MVLTKFRQGGQRMFVRDRGRYSKDNEMKGRRRAIAKGIVEFRENVGDIKSMDELLEVKGVTPEVLEKLKQAVTVEAIEGAECSC